MLSSNMKISENTKCIKFTIQFRRRIHKNKVKIIKFNN